MDDFSGPGILDKGAGRHLNDQILSFFTGFLTALAMAAVRSLEIAFKPKLIKRAQPVGGFDQNIAAVTTVAAVRSPFGNVFFPSKTYAAPAAVAGGHVNYDFINKFHAA